VGFGSGIERVLLNMERLGQEPKSTASTSVYVAPLVKGAVPAALRLSHELQRVGVSTESGFGPASPRSHLRRANALTAEIAILIGEDELQKNVVAIKPLDGSDQIAAPRDQAIDTVRNLLKPST
jgi:histidyl-tRNA synthetase